METKQYYKKKNYNNNANVFTAKFMEDALRKKVTVTFGEYKEKIKDILDEYGFVVVTDILSNQEIGNAESLLYEDLLESIDYENIKDNRLLKVVQNIKDSKLHWPKSSIPGIVKKGFMSYYGFPQGKFAWNLRTNTKCKEIYQFLHNEDDLVVGADLPFFNPDNNPLDNSDLWPHADQNINLKKGCDNSYQGILYVWDSTQNNTSNTIIWPESWKKEYYDLLSAIPKSFGTGIDHGLYIKDIPDNDIKTNLFSGWKKNSRRIQVPSGSLLIFNSRSIHQGYPSGLRLAQTLSWEPRIYRNEDALLRKLQAIHMGIGTTHWASLGIHHGASFCKYQKEEKYSNYHNACVIPMKKITSFPLNKQIKFNKGTKIDLMMQNIKDEYKDVI